MAKNIFGSNQFFGLFVSHLPSEWHKNVASSKILAIEAKSNGFEKNWRKKIFWFRKFPLFWPSNPYLWSHYFLFLTFPKWSFSQVVVQLNSFNLSQKAALGVKTRAKLRKIYEKNSNFTNKNIIFSRFFKFFPHFSTNCNI